MRWAATHFPAALARFCHRWNLSATWTASVRAGPSPVGIRAGAVPADDLCAWMGREPLRERLGVASLDQVERRAGLDVDEQCAVVLAWLLGALHCPVFRGDWMPVSGGADHQAP